MSQAEFVAWVRYYRMHPFDDYHRIHRPAALASGGDIEAALDWLAPEQPVQDGLSAADMSFIKVLGGGG